MLKITLILLLCCIAGHAALSGEAERSRSEAKFETYAIGGMEVTALLNAINENGNASILIGMGLEDKERAARPGALRNGVNAFVVRINGKVILFDAGLPNGGVAAALGDAGIKPEDIDAVVITHFHMDHIGGLLRDGKPVFTQAELFVPRVEVDKWSGSGTDFLLAYSARTNAFEYDREILPGVTALAAPGHTPGHAIYMLESGGKKLLVIGDLIHVPAIQLPNPDIAVTYDSDTAAAIASRKRVFDLAATEKLPVASMHIPFPGLGVLAKEGKGYTFTGL